MVLIEVIASNEDYLLVDASPLLKWFSVEEIEKILTECKLTPIFGRVTLGNDDK